ncbi:DUF397 domain-containing protein [Sphaerimonospora cavernae]|uniref:DUF397 domain-containing protein n=1 Tax=Sphaerimonospora cavernae TaxID=1740611 RepID=A0ABV6U352_9ACTN
MNEELDLSRAVWRKSSISGGSGQCVEVAITDTVVGVRDTKNREGGTLVFNRDEWRAFLGGVRNGEFDID